VVTLHPLLASLQQALHVDYNGSYMLMFMQMKALATSSLVK
jgi:hypothetical protein